MLAPLDNETFFKKAFTNKIVFEQFILDIFQKKISVNKIETEKKFEPKAGYIDMTIDIFAETTDHRFVIEIQRIDYDHNFDRFLYYFLQTITQQQKKAKNYTIKQEVLAIVILTQPYKLHKKTNQAFQDNVMTLDFNLRNIKGDIIKIWGHNLVFLNPHPKYENQETPQNYKDWFKLIRKSLLSEAEQKTYKYSLNLHNKGIAKAVSIINYDNLTGEEIRQAKIAEGKKIMRIKNRNEIVEKVKKQFEEKIQKQEKALEQKEKALEQTKQRLILSAKAMLKSGMSVEQIVEITNLSIQQIQDI